MQYRQLQYFIAVAEQLNFRRAADTLYVSQPLLSKQIADLEAELGQKLFIRNTRSVELTPSGKLLLTEAKNLLQRTDAVVDLIRNTDASEKLHGTLSIGYERSFGRITLVKAIRSFRKKYPNINLNMRDYSNSRIFRALHEDEIDCAFILLPDRKWNRSYACQLICNDEYCFIAAKRRIINNSLEEYIRLCQTEALYLLSNDTASLQIAQDVCGKLKITPRFQFVDSLRILLLYTESGKGASMIPWTMYESYNTPYLTALKFGQSSMVSCMAGVWHEHRENTLRDLLLAEFPPVAPRCADCAASWCPMHKK